MQNDINLDYADFQTIFSHRGDIDGVVRYCNVADFTSDFSESFKLSLQNAKGVLVEFERHSDFSIASIAQLMDELYALTREDADVIFGTKTLDTLDAQTIGFKIVATGLEFSKSQER